MVGWTHAWNTPSPGNSLSVSEHELAPWSGLPFFNISYNFTGAATNDEWLTLGTDQGYVNTAPGMPLLAVPGVVGVRFAASNPRAVRTPIVVTVRDSAGKTFGSYPELEPNGSWSLSLPPSLPPSLPLSSPLSLSHSVSSALACSHSGRTTACASMGCRYGTPLSGCPPRQTLPCRS